MHDDWHGHRDPRNNAPTGDKDAWIGWDYALITALGVIEDYSDENGLLGWEIDDEAVEVNAVKKFNKFKASIENITSGAKYKASPGEYFVPEVTTRRSSGEFQTFSEWVQNSIDAKIEE